MRWIPTSVGPDDPGNVARARYFTFCGLPHLFFDDVEILQAGSGVEQDNGVTRSEEFVSAQLAIGCQGGCAFGRGKQTLHSRPLSKGIHYFFVCHCYRDSVALLQNVENKVVP